MGLCSCVGFQCFFLAAFEHPVFEHCLEVAAELPVDVRLDTGEMAQAFAILPLGVVVVVAGGEVAGELVERSFLELADQLAQRKGEPRLGDGQRELALVFILDAVGDAAPCRAGAQADHITRGGSQADAGDFNFAGKVGG